MRGHRLKQEGTYIYVNVYVLIITHVHSGKKSQLLKHNIKKVIESVKFVTLKIRWKPLIAFY